MLELTITKRTDPRLLVLMASHYSQPKGFVGRNICYAIHYDGVYYGHIVAGSATRFLPGRDKSLPLNNIVNNIFYHIEKQANRYPRRNFTSYVLDEFMKRVMVDWPAKYGDHVVAFESLVELPRSGDLYRKAGWSYIGQTKGFTCKRIGGKGTDSWTGKRLWNTETLRPKAVFLKVI